MEMLVIVGLGLLTYAVIGGQHAAMRRIMKARIEDRTRDDERRNR